MWYFLVILGAAVNFYGCTIYIRDIFRGTTRPNLVTWVLWALAPLIAAGAAFYAGNRWVVLPTFMVGFCPILVIIAAIIKKNAIWQPSNFDYFCGSLSLMALILLLFTKNADLAIVFSIISDLLAGLPTLKKAWLFPDTESGITYIAALFNIFTSFTVLKIYNFSELAFPIYSVFLNFSMSFFIYRKKFKL
ncbi:MAG: hypothetical protein P4L74_06600 [Candidatus Doudnabacteria bacterium]|nr:hypothetical protein [Candidatus Doudnabacteria bacterium]